MLQFWSLIETSLLDLPHPNILYALLHLYLSCGEKVNFFVFTVCILCLFQTELQAQDGRTEGVGHITSSGSKQSRQVAQRGPHPTEPQRQGGQIHTRRGRERE